MYPPNNQTIEMTSFGIEGNIIDHSWYHLIKYKNGKTDANAIIILSDLVYWYRPYHKIDEETGQHKIYKKFKEDILQRSYPEMERLFGFTKEQSRKALETLESLGIVERETRTVEIGGVKVPNILFIRFNHKKLLELMKNYYEKSTELKKIITSSVITDPIIGYNPQCDRLKPSNTYTTSKTTSKTLKVTDCDAGEKKDFGFSKKANFPLKKDQLQLFSEMKSLDLQCDDEILMIIIRDMYKKNKVDFLKDCIYNMKFTIDSGYKFRKERIAFFRNCISGKQALITEIAVKNKYQAECYCKNSGWNEVKITEKYAALISDGKTIKEISMSLPEEEFKKQFVALHKLSKGYC